MADAVRYELVPPYERFRFSDPDGRVVAIEAAGYSTDDPRQIAELDLQQHAVRRVEKKGGSK